MYLKLCWRKDGQTPLTVAVCVSGRRCESWWAKLDGHDDAASSAILAASTCCFRSRHVGQEQWGTGCRGAPPHMLSVWKSLQAETPPGRACCRPSCWETIFLPSLSSSLQTCQASQVSHAPSSQISCQYVTKWELAFHLKHHAPVTVNLHMKEIKEQNKCYYNIKSIGQGVGFSRQWLIRKSRQLDWNWLQWKLASMYELNKCEDGVYIFHVNIFW